MDTDLLKPAPEDHMAEMMLLMQMDKLSPEFANAGSPSDLPVTDPTIPRNPYESMNSFMNPSFHNQTAPFPTIQNTNNAYWRFNENEDGNSMFPTSGNCTGNNNSNNNNNNKQNSMAAMREMIFRIAAMQPIYIDPETVKPPKRRNVKISKDPQSVAARHRRERISERIRILQRLVPGGTKMDTASMLDEAIHYVKFLKTQVQSLERAAVNRPPPPSVHGGVGFPVVMSTAAAVNEGNGYFPVMKGYPVMHNGEGSQAHGFSSDG